MCNQKAREPEPWIPPVGKLIVRLLVDEGRTDMELSYPDSDNVTYPSTSPHFLHVKTIARLRYWESGPYFAPFLDTARGQLDKTGAGSTVVRREADDGDILAILRLWAPEGRRPPTLTSWMEDVMGEADLAADEKARLARLVAQVLNPPKKDDA